MKRTLVILGKIFVGLLVLAAIAAALLLIGAQFWPGATDIVINVGSEEIPMVGVFGAGLVTLIVAWAALAVAIVVGTFAVVFALFVTGAALVLTGLFLGFPFIVGGLIVWLVMRRKARRSDTGAGGGNGSNGNTLPPPTASAA
jgi:hypothetical protein